MDVEQGEVEPRERKCPVCGADASYFVKTKEGKVVCSKCGTIVDEQLMDRGAEYRVFGQEDMDKVRVGPSISPEIPEWGVSTEVTVSGPEISGRRIRDLEGAHKLRKTDLRIKFASLKNRKIVEASQILESAASELNLPRIMKENTMLLFGNSLERGLDKGRNIRSLIAGITYIICRQMRVPRTVENLAKAFNVEKKELGKSARYIMKSLEIKVLPMDPALYVPGICSNLNLGVDRARVETLAIKIIQKAKEKKISVGKDPRGTAAAAVYYACRLLKKKVTQKEMADIVGITEVTIRNQYKKMKEMFTRTKLVEQIAYVNT